MSNNLKIDGLITGLDTSSIIEGLLEIQQRQVDQLNARRATVLGKKSAFSGIEGRLISIRGALGRLSSFQTSALLDKTVSTSNEDAVAAAATDDAVSGIFRLRVNRLASSSQIATSGFNAADTEIGTGSVSVQVGNTGEVAVAIDDTNNTVQGLVNAINASDADVTASLINDGSGADSFRILVSSNKTGESSAVTINSNLSGGQNVAFDQTVQEAENAEVSFGSGPGAIVVSSETNRISDLIFGVTLNLKSADPNEEITLTVGQDTEAGIAAVSDFVDAYNSFIDYVNDQTSFNAEANVAGTLLGERSVSQIYDELQLAMTGVVDGLNSQINRLTSIGVSVNNNGSLSLDESRLGDILAGEVDGISATDVGRLFSLGADSTFGGFTFVAGSSDTNAGEIQVDITDAAQKASITASNIFNDEFVVDGNNSTFTVTIDGVESSTLTLTEGTYDREDLAAHLQSVINADSELGNRGVVASVVDDTLSITSGSFGSNSEVSLTSGDIWDSLGFDFNGDETDRGQDVVGSFIVDGVVESATGRGTLLVADPGNANTDGLQIRVNISGSDIVPGAEGTLTVTRGLAAGLDDIIGKMLAADGIVDNINERYDDTDASILKSIENLNAQIESQKESLIRQFAALESAVSQLQSTGNFLSTQFAGLSGLSA